MLTYIVAVVVELAVLYFLSQRLLKDLYSLFFLISRSRPVGVSVVSLLTFPGTVIHELSHMFTAEALGVRTGGLSLSPEAIDQPEVRAGSVMINRTDPIRRSLIGTAPFFWGLTALSVLAYYFQPQLSATWNALLGGTLGSSSAPYLTAGIVYLMFAISNSMFSSKEDMQGFPAVALVAALLAGALYAIGVRLTLTGQVQSAVTRLLMTLSQSIGIVLGINLAILLATRAATGAASRITKRKLVALP